MGHAEDEEEAGTAMAKSTGSGITERVSPLPPVEPEGELGF